jgi:quercetin dioxygenase-like cupin family protein
VIARR